MRPEFRGASASLGSRLAVGETLSQERLHSPNKSYSSGARASKILIPVRCHHVRAIIMGGRSTAASEAERLTDH